MLFVGTPPATASLLTGRLPMMMALAALIGACCGVVGLYLSYYFSLASGASIVLVCTGVFLVVLLLAPRRIRPWLQSLRRSGYKGERP